MTKISLKLVDFIKKHEGLSLYPYVCPAGKLTVGYGHVIRNNDIILGVNGKLLNRILNKIKKFIQGFRQINNFLKTLFPRSMSQRRADQILKQDIQKFFNGIKPLIKVDLSKNQIYALTSLTYNIGLGAFKKSTLLRLINQEKFTEAAQQFDRWVYANGKKLNGLVKRRNEEKMLFLE